MHCILNTKGSPRNLIEDEKYQRNKRNSPRVIFPWRDNSSLSILIGTYSAPLNNPIKKCKIKISPRYHKLWRQWNNKPDKTLALVNLPFTKSESKGKTWITDTRHALISEHGGDEIWIELSKNQKREKTKRW